MRRAGGLRLLGRGALGPLGGIVNQNRLPCPGALSQPISPSISSISRLAMERPSPVPPYWLALCGGLGIGLEQPLLLELAEADAGVGNVEAQLEPAACIAGIGVQTHRAGRGELHGIVDEVGEHLANTARIADDETRAARTDIDDAFDAFLPRPRLQFAADAPHQLMQIEHRAVELEAACLEL